MADPATPPQDEEREAELTLIHTHKWGTGFFLILFAGGAFALIRQFEIELPQQAHWLVVFVLFLAGLILVGYRSGVTLDREDKLAVSWRSLFGLRMVSDEINTAEACNVLLSVDSETRRDENETEHVRIYTIAIEGEGATIELDELEDAYREAQQSSERFARFLWVPIVDSTSGERVQRDPESIDESLRDRLRRTQEFPESMPASKAFEVSQPDDTTTRFEVPGRMGFFRGLKHLFFLAFGGAAGGFAGNLFLNETHEILKPIWLGLTVVAGLLLLWTLIQILKDLTTREILTLTPETFSLTTRWALWKSTDHMPMNDLEELMVNTERGERLREFAGLRARSDDEVLDFGEYLDIEEREQLRDALFHVIATL